ncbi:MAG TPA: hypothetical protein VHR43_01960 [Gemmatimonadales bacterium]|jgi:hypothetical protein|nr:hypothetical protein [Gemmatimonadales bacterium]
MRLCFAILIAAGLAGCGGHSVKIDPNAQPVATRWNALLTTPAGLAGALQIRGMGWMGGKDESKVEAHVEITNASPGGRHPWHVHLGQCGTDRGILGDAKAYPILKVGGDGKADADAELDVPLPLQGQYFVNVHASPTNMGTIVACGNLAPPTR